VTQSPTLRHSKKWGFFYLFGSLVLWTNRITRLPVRLARRSAPLRRAIRQGSFVSSCFTPVFNEVRLALPADFFHIAFLVRSLAIFIGLAVFERHRLIANGATWLPPLQMAKDSMYGRHLGPNIVKR
jgi:hypothetical protein